MARSQYDGITDNLRLPEAELERLVHDIAQRPPHPRAANRKHARYLYARPRIPILLRDRYTHATRWHVARPFDLSQHGMSFLHGCFVYTDTECIADLIALDGAVTRVTGVVRWCRHVELRVHQIGIQLDDGITIADFVTDAAAEETPARRRSA